MLTWFGTNVIEFGFETCIRIYIYICIYIYMYLRVDVYIHIYVSVCVILIIIIFYNSESSLQRHRMDRMDLLPHLIPPCSPIWVNPPQSLSSSSSLPFKYLCSLLSPAIDNDLYNQVENSGKFTFVHWTEITSSYCEFSIFI